jgi:acyl-coenzyme A synthetase/AMP-(fatty) acid ligase
MSQPLEGSADSSSNAACNVADRLRESARAYPQQVAIAEPKGEGRYRQITFAEFDAEVDRLARGLIASGARPGMRIVLMVPMGIQLIALVFAMLRAGLVMILVDPGMGRSNLLACLEEAKPEGFVAIPLVQAIRAVLRRRFPAAKFLVTVGWRWFWGGLTLSAVRKKGTKTSEQTLPVTRAQDPAAIIFTTGSTGPPKGVLYEHRQFDQQVVEIRDFYGIKPGEIDVPGFPLFALFNAAMGVTTVIPQMDFTRPAKADPRKIIAAITDWKATQAFGSPALLNVVGHYCREHNLSLPTLKRVLSAGAPVPPHVLWHMKQAIALDGDVHTPYGATEALPIASMPASELLAETVPLTNQGKGTCVGRPFPGIRWKAIAIDDGPLKDIRDTREVSRDEIGELMVSGPVVTRQYVTRTDANALHKVADGKSFWHRMGDVGYFDDQGRFWFCGRKAHRVTTSRGVMFTICCEAIYNQHRNIYRSALVGVGEPGNQRPVIIAEPWPDRFPESASGERELVEELISLGKKSELTQSINDVFVMKALPVDIRHNAKIFREKLAVWAAKKLGVIS